jgi:hypothetical protein
MIVYLINHVAVVTVGLGFCWAMWLFGPRIMQALRFRFGGG